METLLFTTLSSDILGNTNSKKRIIIPITTSRAPEQISKCSNLTPPPPQKKITSQKVTIHLKLIVVIVTNNLNTHQYLYVL